MFFVFFVDFVTIFSDNSYNYSYYRSKFDPEGGLIGLLIILLFLPNFNIKKQ